MLGYQRTLPDPPVDELHASASHFIRPRACLGIFIFGSTLGALQFIASAIARVVRPVHLAADVTPDRVAFHWAEVWRKIAGCSIKFHTTSN